MLLPQLGETRSARRADHLLQTPDTFVRAPLPGMKDAVAIVHTAPELGACFTQYTAEMTNAGTLGDTIGQRFVYVLEGKARIDGHSLPPGGYAYIPQGVNLAVTSIGASRLAVLEKLYEPLTAVAPPQFFVGAENTVAPQPLMGDDALQVRALLPDEPAFDFAINTMTYAPGASLSRVEIHVMEHGLLMLEGGGIYRLGDHWYPATAGDFIWMAPYCPQWFGALGKTPTKYLIYKDWNRSHL
jgi:(S)-ureidoglycine aminohydrolase